MFLFFFNCTESRYFGNNLKETTTHLVETILWFAYRRRECLLLLSLYSIFGVDEQAASTPPLLMSPFFLGTIFLTREILVWVSIPYVNTMQMWLWFCVPNNWQSGVLCWWLISLWTLLHCTGFLKFLSATVDSWCRLGVKCSGNPSYLKEPICVLKCVSMKFWFDFNRQWQWEKRKLDTEIDAILLLFYVSFLLGTYYKSGLFLRGCHMFYVTILRILITVQMLGKCAKILRHASVLFRGS